MSDAYSLLIEGKILEMVKLLLDTSFFGMFAWAILFSAIVLIIYIKSESLLMTGFVSFFCLGFASVVWQINSIPIVVAILVVFITLIIFDLFIKKKDGGY